MDARSRRLLISALCIGATLLAVPAFAASYRTTNFIVRARNESHARQIGEAAERFRRDLAIEWLDRELPPWRQPCPIHVDVNPAKGAGGATSFSFQNRRPIHWEMDVQGSFERIMDSVLPHEVTHTIFATHFGGPLPRWADEGACTTVEHTSERKKQEDWLIRFIHERRGIPFNRMFAMTEYPRDILPLYAQGYSVTRYLIAQGGKQKFIAFVGDGIATNNWNAAVQKHYGYDRLGDLQLAWQAWLGRGQSIADVRRPGESNVVLASATAPTEAVSPSSRAQGTRPVIEQVAATGSDGWYARQVNTVASPVHSDRIDRADRSAADKRVDRGRQSATVTAPTQRRGEPRVASRHDDSGWTSLSIRSKRDASLFR